MYVTVGTKLIAKYDNVKITPATVIGSPVKNPFDSEILKRANLNAPQAIYITVIIIPAILNSCKTKEYIKRAGAIPNDIISLIESNCLPSSDSKLNLLATMPSKRSNKPAININNTLNV